MTAVEKPDPYYPLYYLLDRGMPAKVRYRLAEGRDPDEYSKSLHRKSWIELRDWIASSDIPHELVFDLHDNTPHQEELKYLKETWSRDGIKYIETKKGFVARKSDSFVDVDYSSNLPKFDQMMKSFKSKTIPQIRYQLDNAEHEKMGMIPFAPTDIAFEYYPAILDEWTGELRKISVNKGLRFFVELFDHIRNNYMYERVSK